MDRISDSNKNSVQANYTIKEMEFIVPSVTRMHTEQIENNNQSDQDELKFYEKFSFGIAGLPFQAYFCAIGVFTTVYLLNKAGLPPEKTT